MHSFTHFPAVFTLLFFLVEHSYQIDCTNQAVTFTQNYTSFVITSDPNDLAAKTCKYTFTVPKYFVPTIIAVDLRLTGNNKITTRQYSEYGGYKNYEFVSDAQWVLGPVNFTIDLSLPDKSANDSFIILISVKDKTPAVNGRTFLVDNTLSTIIDSDSVQGNSSLLQMFDALHVQDSFNIKVAIFTEGILLYNLIQNIHIYDLGVYKGSLLDVLVAENSSQTCAGSQFAIVNTNGATIGVYSILISTTNGPRGNGQLDVYAGCVTGPHSSKLIATITPSNAANYEKLMMFGRCKTYVLTQGVFQWTKYDTYFTDYKHEIGRQGVIMSDNFPYTYDDTITRNYLIQAPNDKQNIIVKYEVAEIASNSAFQIKEDISAGKESYRSLSSADAAYTSSSTY
ncbi:unnamed protein product [Caenorhabditis sp. 36 PRJEB53466]|nr:unnamed protein product [Caenorhabditis sp. 36 PRJEB53466]